VEQERSHKNFSTTTANAAQQSSKIISTATGHTLTTVQQTNNSSVVVWGTNLESGVGKGKITNVVRKMYDLPRYQSSVILGLLLSDGWTIYSSSTRKSGVDESKLNARLGFKQSLDKFYYFFSVFNDLAHYCSSFPYLNTGKRNNTITYALVFQTRALPCLTKYHQLFYVNGKKIVPKDIYNLLDPVVLTHWICGDGVAKTGGLGLCTDSYSIEEVVKLVNVLIIRYRFICKIREIRKNQYRIFISEKSLGSLRNIVLPYIDKSMLYKIDHLIIKN